MVARRIHSAYLERGSVNMYASKTPRDLNHDPRPYRNDHNEARVKHYIIGQERQGWIHDPRPEFDHVQHNEPNPILVAHRLDRGANIYYAHLPEYPTEAHIKHAHRVLTRLAAFVGETGNKR